MSNKINVYSDELDEISIIPTSIAQYARNEFWKKIEQNSIRNILTFHQHKDMTIINILIYSEGRLYTEPNYEDADDALANIYDAKSKSERNWWIKRRNKCLESSPVYSKPHVLAMIHSVVTTYPDLIVDVENPLYVQRAFNFIEGSYIHMLERAMSPPTITVHRRSENSELRDMINDLHSWVENAVSVAYILLSQYGVTGDEKYLSTLNSTYMFKDTMVLFMIKDLISENYVYRCDPQAFDQFCKFMIINSASIALEWLKEQ